MMRSLVRNLEEFGEAITPHKRSTYEEEMQENKAY